MFRKVIFSLALLASVPALAATPQLDQAPTQRVSYADLDVNTAAGAMKLQQRVKYAIRAVCPGMQSADLHLRRLGLQCAQNARNAAQVQIAALSHTRGTELASASR